MNENSNTTCGNAAELPGHSSHNEVVKGYRISRMITFNTGQGFVIAHSKTAVDPFVCWRFKIEDGVYDFFWGKYCGSEQTAIEFYIDRVRTYIKDYNAVEVPYQAQEERSTIT